MNPHSPRSSKEMNLLKSNILYCSKIKLIKVISHNKNLNNTYYIKLEINNENSHLTKEFNFIKSNISELNQTFALDMGQKLTELTFKFYDKKSNINLFTGIIKDQHFILDEKSGDYIIHLKNNEDSDHILLYYSLEFSAIDSIKSFDDNYKQSNLIKKNKSFDAPTSTKFQPNESTKKTFISNLRYIILINKYLDQIIHWKSSIKTITFLISISLIIYYFKTFYIYVFPMIILFMHAMKKNKLNSYLIDKSIQDNPDIQKENELFYLKLLSTYNSIIDNYENFISNIFSEEKTKMENMYRSLIFTIVLNIIFFYLKLFHLINIKLILISFINLNIIRHNPFLCSLFLKIYNFIIKFTSIIPKPKIITNLKDNSSSLLKLLIPFYSIYLSYIDNNSNVYHSAVKNQGNDNSEINVSKSFERRNSLFNKGTSLVKVELYEVQRWWVVVGWTSNVGYGQNSWHRVNKPNEFCDKNSIFLPDNENARYNWDGEWKIEKMEHSDAEGWEYSDSPSGVFSENKTGKFVRRRKWIRFANKI